METLIQDIRFGIRNLLKSPGFTIVAVLTLALGIGANSSIFSVVNGVLLQPLPYKDPDGLFAILTNNSSRGLTNTPFSYGRLVHMQQQTKALDGLSGYTGDAFTITSNGEPESLNGARLSYGTFSLLGVKPALGRDFLAEEDTPGGNLTAIISNGLWLRRFGGDPSIAGKPITLDGKSYTVIGVMPADFNFPFPGTDIWTTKVFDVAYLTKDQVNAGAGYIFGIARLKAGVTRTQALSEMDSISEAYHVLTPNAIDADPHAGVRLTPLKEQVVQNVRPTLLVLLAAVGFVLLIACVNVANLLLSKAVARGKEIAVRTALGASRARIVRQLLTESMILAIVGGALGLLLASQGVRLIANASANNLPRSQFIKIDSNVLLFSLAISLLTGVVFGLVPALRASNPNLNDTLKDGGRSGTEGLAKNRLRSALVVSEIALSLVLLIGSGLLIQSFAKLQSVNPGFDSHNVLTMFLSLPQSKYPDFHTKGVFFNDVVEHIKRLPGAEAASVSLSVPLNGGIRSPYQIEGRPPRDIGDRPLCELQDVTSDYFKVMGIPLLSGRFFNEHDQENSQRVVIISAAMAKAEFPNENPLGKHMDLGRLPNPAEIVGVVADVKTTALNTNPGGVTYMCFPQRAVQGAWLSVKTSGDPLSFAKTVTAQILSVDRDQPVTAVQTMDQVISTSIGPQRLIMFLLGIFAGLALVLASIGIYGVMSYSVTQRTQEIGIRMALGAQRGDVLKLVMKQTLILAGIGVGIGIVAALRLTGLMESQLFGIHARDPITFVGISIFLTAISIVASLIPARRASRVDPMVALRYQ
ncbi:MAG TPA: ABC transporter permease [Blastocatellia bacterium]|nr:ABC transporter permease [Blastocatellia bacterium]